MHYVLLNLNIMLYVYAAENLGTFHLLVLNAAHNGSVIDFVVLSTCSQSVQPPFKMPQPFWKGKFPFPLPNPFFA